MTTATQQRKEPEVLSHSSLAMLARGVGKESLKGVEFAMYLNIPTTTIIKCIADITDTPLTNEGSEQNKMDVTQKCLFLWKELTKCTKTNQRVKELERALREIGKADIADILQERHQNSQELTQEIFG
ncbi:uncharacterized protein LOC131955661 [Physella acuta]|uniref:uncharacterized protein LOC131955661 n=1 Tax=Physella acuta TaxID=109671 RepID=UPI0027DE732B|nr:uncharacterized protein LOC131955661 [Physella acuta]